MPPPIRDERIRGPPRLDPPPPKEVKMFSAPPPPPPMLEKKVLQDTVSRSSVFWMTLISLEDVIGVCSVEATVATTTTGETAKATTTGSAASLETVFTKLVINLLLFLHRLVSTASNDFRHVNSQDLKGPRTPH